MQTEEFLKKLRDAIPETTHSSEYRLGFLEALVWIERFLDNEEKARSLLDDYLELRG